MPLISGIGMIGRAGVRPWVNATQETGMETFDAMPRSLT
jgi:hypothetical protein